MQQIQYFFRKSNLRGIVASCKNASHLCKYNPIKRKVFESRSQAETQITGQGNKSTAGCRMTAKLAGTSACSNLRNAYNDCFNRWYSEKFMKGQWDKEECVAEWEAYRACIMKNVEDKNLSRLLKMEATAYPTVSGPGRPLHSEDGSK